MQIVLSILSTPEKKYKWMACTVFAFYGEFSMWCWIVLEFWAGQFKRLDLGIEKCARMKMLEIFYVTVEILIL